MKRAWAVARLICVLAAMPASAQEALEPDDTETVPAETAPLREADATVTEEAAPLRIIPSPVLIVDIERIYAESDFGRRVERDYQEAGRILEAENAVFLAELEAEERSIAERRESMTVEEFRAEAEAFDLKVQDIRARQDEREAQIETARAAGQSDFRARLRPVLGQIMLDNRGVVLLEATDAYVFLTTIDITDQAIEAANQVLGDGTP